MAKKQQEDDSGFGEIKIEYNKGEIAIFSTREGLEKLLYHIRRLIDLPRFIDHIHLEWKDLLTKDSLPCALYVEKDKNMDEVSKEKFAHLRDLKKEEVTLPDYAFLNFSVCAMDKHACGWGGWTFDSVFAIDEEKKQPTGTGDRSLSANNLPVCPNCGKGLYCTEIDVKMKIER